MYTELKVAKAIKEHMHLLLLLYIITRRIVGEY